MKKSKTILLAIILIPLCFIIPVNILMIYNSADSIHKAKEMVVHENLSILQLYANSLQKEMRQIDNYMNLLVNENYAYLKLSNGITDPEDEEFYEVQNRILSDFKQYIAMNDSISNITALFHENDVKLVRDNLGRFDKIDKELLTFLENGPTETESLGTMQRWHWLEINSKSYLIALYQSEYASCAVALCLDRVLSEMNEVDSLALSTYYFSFDGQYYKVTDSSLIDRETVDLRYREDQNEKYFDHSVQIMDLDLYLGGFISEEALNRQVPGISRVIRWISLLACLIAPMISLVFYYLVEKPLKSLNYGMDEVRKGHTDYRIPSAGRKLRSEFDGVNEHFNQMLDDLEDTKLKLYQEEIDRQKVQLRYLNQQIRPHFILNALNIIYSYDDDEFPVAKKVVIYLVKYFRYLVNLNSDYVLLWEEMEFTSNYLKIQKIRYPKRFTYFVEWEEELRYAKIPAVVIQTFVENSIKYGFIKGKSMFIFVLARKEDDTHLKITIADTGKGIAEHEMKSIQRFLATKVYQDEVGTGIQNVVSRLEILYGNEVDISIYNADDGGTRVELTVPVMYDITKGEEDDSGTIN